MAPRTGQTYATHRQVPTAFIVTFVAALIAVLITVVLIVDQPALFTLGLLLMSLALLSTVHLARWYALRVQDRIIRLEMQLRFARLGLDAAAAVLTLRQIIALRFASDAELPALVARAGAEQLSPDQIKRAITNWQGDYHRV
jgi:hypothetical protein